MSKEGLCEKKSEKSPEEASQEGLCEKKSEKNPEEVSKEGLCGKKSEKSPEEASQEGLCEKKSEKSPREENEKGLCEKKSEKSPEKGKGEEKMEEIRQYRHENKYDITYAQYLALRQRLRTVMKPDPYARADGTYRIRSIYFDNLADKALMEKKEGVLYREKFRIRYYNDDFSHLTLEKKIKNRSLTRKESAPLSLEECERILNGDIAFLKEHPDPLVRELYLKMRQQLLKPKVLVSYVREPYIYAAGNVRVTFDWEIRTSLWEQRFLSQEVYDISCHAGKSSNASSQDGEPGSEDSMLMEVKYDNFLPEIIQLLLQTDDIRQRAFSKYGACRNFG